MSTHDEPPADPVSRFLTTTDAAGERRWLQQLRMTALHVAAGSMPPKLYEDGGNYHNRYDNAVNDAYLDTMMARADRLMAWLSSGVTPRRRQR